MTRQAKNFELLSAYLDDELSYEEKVQVEKNIKSSLQLQKKLEDLKKIKQLTSSTYKKIPESPYFETRLFASLDSQKPWHKNVFKWAPAIGLVLTTIIIMIVLKSNPDLFNNLIEKQKSNITGFYKENLQPLLFAADLNKEDIFNFAMYKQLPLDKDDKQILHIDYDKTGKEFFEIKSVESPKNENNFEKFIVALNLDEKAKKQIDSIMNQYAEELEAQVFINKNNTVAINSNLWNYQRAIQSDLLAFAEKSNQQEFQKLVPKTVTYNNSRDVVLAVNEMRNTRNKNYIFLTSDSVFSEPMEYNPDEYKLQLAEFEKAQHVQDKRIREINFQFKYDAALQKLENNIHHNYNIVFDSNFCRVEISKFDFPNIHFPDFDSLFNVYDSVANNFKFHSQYIPRIKHFDNKIQFHFDGDSLNTYEFEYYKFDLDSLLESQSELIDSLQSYNWNNIFEFNDSLVLKSMPKLDSYFKFYDGEVEIKLEMEKLRSELEKFRGEMKQWKEELKRDSHSRDGDKNSLK
jgi:hypothetical protein